MLERRDSGAYPGIGGIRRGLVAAAGLMLAGAAAASLGPRGAEALGQTRTISLFNVHTKETITATFKKGGEFVQDELDRLNWFLRDWREDQKIKMDPKLIDLLWELHRELGSEKPIHLISGYRSPKTNSMLRRRGRAVARRSRHMLGKAADVYFPDVSTKRLREYALVHRRGGVGYYPRSGKYGFVHIDTGRVRHWPRMKPAAYAKLMSKRNEMLGRSREQGKPTQIASLFGGGNKASDEKAVAEAVSKAVVKPAAAKPGLPSREHTAPTPERKPLRIARLESRPGRGLDLPGLIKREIPQGGQAEASAPAPGAPVPRSKPRAIARLAVEPPARPVLTASISPVSHAALEPAGANPGQKARGRKGDRLDLRLAATGEPGPAETIRYRLRTRRIVINRESKGNLMMTRTWIYTASAQ